MAKAMLKDESAVKLIEEFEKNPNAFGITLNQEAYFFSSGIYYGLLLPVNDKKQVKDTFLRFKIADEKSILSEKGVYSFAPDKTLNIAWNNNKLIVLLQYGTGEDKAILSAQTLLTQNKDASILSNKNFNKFMKDKKDISSYVSPQFYAELSNTLERSGNKFTSGGIPSEEIENSLKYIEEEFKGVSLAMNTSFENGKIEVNSHYYFETPDAEAKFKKLVHETTGTLTDKYLQHISSSPIISFATNLKGGGYYSVLSRFGILKSIESDLTSQGINLKSLFESVQGNVVFSLDGLTLTPRSKNISEMDAMLALEDYSPKTNMKFSLFAELAPNNHITKFIDSLVMKQPEKVVSKTGKGQYSIKNNNFNGYFGVENNTFYLTTEPELLNSIGKENEKSTYSDRVKDKNLYLYGNFDPLKQYARAYYDQHSNESNAEYKTFVNEGLSLVESIEGYSKPDLTNEIRVNFTDKKANSLASLFRYIDSVLTKTGAQLGL
jgi:hypothetical protein